MNNDVLWAAFANKLRHRELSTGLREIEITESENCGHALLIDGAIELDMHGSDLILIAGRSRQPRIFLDGECV